MPKISMVLEFQDESELRAYLDGKTRAVPAAPADQVEQDDDVQDVTESREAPEGPTENDVDVDGMPYDREVHSYPPVFVADGRWRAGKGKADAAKAARAAFLASGGNEIPPADLPAAPAAPVAAPALPDLPAAPAAAPALPGLPQAMRAPVTVETLFSRIGDAVLAGKGGELMELYRKHVGTDVHAEVGARLQTNESARAALMDDLEKLLA